MKLGYVILYVPNVTASVLFYERAFGLKRRFVHEDGGYGEMETGATVLAFVDEAFIATSVGPLTLNRPGQAPAAFEVSFVSDDVATDFRKALSAGATPVLAPAQKPWGQTISYVCDNNGILVELCSKVSGS